MSSAALRGRPITGEGAPRWILARTLRATLAKLVLLAFRVKVEGAENIPPGPAVIAGNHVSYLDPVLLWCAWPRPVHFMARIDLWDHKVLGWGLDHLWAFPVTRASADRQALATANDLLKRGELVGIFPEGTRQRDGGAELGEAQGGVSFIAMRAGVPVVPTGIAGTERAMPRGAKFPRLVMVTIRVGEPVRPEDFSGSRKEVVEAMTSTVMDRIAEAREKARAR